MGNAPGTARWSEDKGHWRYASVGDSGSTTLGGHFLLLGECHDSGRRGFLHDRI